jgi:glycosyltransferase involved in cell wall biosynthesis
MASGVPVICAENSSIPEVGGEAPQYFQGKNPEELAMKMAEVLGNESLRGSMVKKGFNQARKFSWEKCARETLEWIKS